MKNDFNLQQHLAQEHKMSPFQTYLKEIVYGGNDGIVTTFAVVAGFAGAQSGNTATYSFFTVLLFGLANLFADGTSMGLGNFLSLRSEQDMYRTNEAKEYHEVATNPQAEKAETIHILQEKGFAKEQAETLTAIYATNKDYWVAWMMQNELAMPNPKGENPYLTATATFLSFVIFGFIPLIPYLVAGQAQQTFLYSCFATLAALVLLGLLRWRITAEGIFRSVLEIVAVGSTAALVAYIVGTFFRTP